jgi:hypothetical protein
VKRVKLARLEAIEANEQTGRLEDRRLGHPIWTPFRVFGGADYRRVLHEMSFPASARYASFGVASAATVELSLRACPPKPRQRAKAGARHIV